MKEDKNTLVAKAEREENGDSGSEIYDSDDEGIVCKDDATDNSGDDDDAVGVTKKELLAADDQQRDFQGRMARQGG